MKRLCVPDDIQLVDALNAASAGEAVSWKRWFLVCVLNDQRMGTSPRKLAMVGRVEDKVLVADAGTELDFEDDEFDVCKAIVEDPTIGLGGPRLMKQLLPFMRAFLDAPHIDPKAEKKA